MVVALVPILTDKSIAAPRLICWIFGIFVVAFTIQAILMITVGIRTGNAFITGVVGPQQEALMAPYMMPTDILSIVCAIVFLMFVVKILVSVARKAS